MAGYHREALEILLSRLQEEPRWLIAVSVPRQSGKTTLVRQALHRSPLGSIYFAVDGFENAEIRHLPGYSEEARFSREPRDRSWLVRTWELARREAGRFPGGIVLALDEIQKIPDWSATVKGLWDADRHAGSSLRVVVLGSGPLLMQGGLSESLTGRFESIPITH